MTILLDELCKDFYILIDANPVTQQTYQKGEGKGETDIKGGSKVQRFARLDLVIKTLLTNSNVVEETRVVKTIIRRKPNE